MKRAICSMLLFGMLLQPAVQAEAKEINISSSTFASSSVSSTVSELNDWLQRTVGLDLYKVINKIIEFMIMLAKIIINLLLDFLPKLKEALSAY